MKWESIGEWRYGKEIRNEREYPRCSRQAKSSRSTRMAGSSGKVPGSKLHILRFGPMDVNGTCCLCA